MKTLQFIKSIGSIVLSCVGTMAFSQATTTQNYLMMNVIKQPGVFTEAAVNGLPIATQGKLQTVAYLDALGRTSQKIVTQGSATKHDLIRGMEYDNTGKEVTKYLPYSDMGNTATAGGYRPGWKTVQSSFYSSGAMANVDASTAPFSVIVPEPSDLNRVAAQGAPGTIWQPNSANPYDPASHALQMKYLVNKEADNIRYFIINPAGVISSSRYDSTGWLNIKITTDEQQQTVKEFTDLFGHVVLKRVMTATDSLETYYIYDSLNLLRAVIQPEGTVVLRNNSWVFPAGFSSNWMFLYRYDERKRMVMKKVPGADSVNMVYDKWDRIVLTQDGNLRAAHFLIFTKYDQLNRPVVTGQITDARILSALQTDVTNATGRFESVNTAATEGYTLNNAFPSSSSYTLTVYSTTHYDSYANLPSWSSGYGFVSENGVGNQNTFLIGQVVATQVRVLGTSTFYRTVSYYDDKYRVIQVTSDNAAGGKDRLTKIMSFDGKTTNDYHAHTSRFYTTALITQQTYSYDHVDRLLSQTHKTANQEVVTLNQISYNEVGQQLNKKLHQATSHPTALQKLDYFYNIRGWVNGMNRPLTTESGYDESDFFSYELHYGTTIMPGATSQYNGNIAEWITKNAYDEKTTGNSYHYDQANRLLSSSWAKYTSTWDATKRYEESGITYDHNGNILTLSRYMDSWGKIDDLTYQNYTGNQLGKVTDASNAVLPTGFQDKTDGSNPDYLYDLNGNMKTDFNKSIPTITYNYLNLPNVVTVTNKGTITYTYDASGNKLQKTIVETTPAKTTNYYYAGDYVYRNDTLEFISHQEGRLRPIRIDTTQAISIANLKYIYDYYLKDHLGSVRSVLTTEQQTDFYGATMEAAAASKEDLLFSNVSSTSVLNHSGFTNDNNNKKSSLLNGDQVAGSKRVGPSIILKVMAGDTISIGTYGWYQGAVLAPPANPADLALEILPFLKAGVIAQNGNKGGAVDPTVSGSLLGTDIQNFVTSGRPYDPSRPKAFLNWMVVGEDFVAATDISNHVCAKQIPICITPDTMKQMVGPTDMVIRRSGWIYVYLSNESAQPVYFDNLVVNFRHGPLVEQKDYYAFGMENPALSSKALKYRYDENRTKYNGKEVQEKEFSDGSGLSWDDYGSRMFDPQIARWMRPDPLTEKMRRFSPYNYAYDNPIRFIDPDGMQPEDWVRYKDAKGDQHVDYNKNVTDQKSAESYVQNKGGSNADYVGQEGYQERGYVKDGEASANYKLNSDGTATRMGEGEAKPSVTKTDVANSEPSSAPSPAEKAATVISTTSSLLEKGVQQGEKLASGAATAVASGSEEAAQLSGLAKQAGALGTTLKTIGAVGTAVSMGYSMATMIQHPTAGNATRVAVQGIAAGAAFIPGVGWGLSLGIGIADAVWGDDFYKWIDK